MIIRTLILYSIVLFPFFSRGQIIVIEDSSMHVTGNTGINGPSVYVTIDLPEINGFNLSFQLFSHPPHFDNNDFPLSNAYTGISNPVGMQVAQSLGPSSPNFYNKCNEFGSILNSGLDPARVYTLGEEISDNVTFTGASLIYSEQFYDASQSLSAAFCGNYYSILPGFNQTYTGFRVTRGGNYYYGWIDAYEEGGTYFLNRIAIESSPNTPIIAGDTSSGPIPNGLNQSYIVSPDGIYLNWTPISDAQGCQVRGGPIGGSDPHNFIVTGNEPNELFINGNSLTEGQEYQWKVRCATGMNPYSGISDWSNYDYFIYEP